MNRNTAELYRMPPEGGGGTACHDSICVLLNAYVNGVSASRAEHPTQSSPLEARRSVVPSRLCEASGLRSCAQRNPGFEPVFTLLNQTTTRVFYAMVRSSRQSSGLFSRKSIHPAGFGMSSREQNRFHQSRFGRLSVCLPTESPDYFSINIPI